MKITNCCVRCLKKKLISKISMITTLLVASTFTTLTAFIKVFGIHKIWQVVYQISFVATIISYIIFGYSFYAARWGKKKAKLILGIIFIVYGFIILVFGIVVSIKKNKIIYELQKVFTGSSFTDLAKHDFEDSLKCCGTDDCRIKHQDRDECFEKIEKLISKFTYSGAPIFIIYSIILWISSIFCIMESKKNQEIENDTKKETLLQTNQDKYID